MVNNQFISDKFGFFVEDFFAEFEKHAIFTEIKAKTEIVREGQKTILFPS